MTGQILAAMHARGTAYWAWTKAEWLEVLRHTLADTRQYVTAVAYLLCGWDDLTAPPLPALQVLYLRRASVW